MIVDEVDQGWVAANLGLLRRGIAGDRKGLAYEDRPRRGYRPDRCSAAHVRGEKMAALNPLGLHLRPGRA